jgi:hypothetical protein
MNLQINNLGVDVGVAANKYGDQRNVIREWDILPKEWQKRNKNERQTKIKKEGFSLIIESAQEYSFFR